MASIKLTGSLVVGNPVEANSSWEDVGASPADLYQAMTRIFAVEMETIESLDQYYIGDSQPEGESTGQIWISNGAIPFIGIPVGSGYTKIYPYPEHVPLLWMGGENRPSYLRRLSPTELENSGLTNPENTDYYYVILSV